MDFNYSDDGIRDLCEKRACAVTALGEAAALELERRLADIDACDNAADFAALCGAELIQVSGRQWALVLAGGHRMLLICGHSRPRITNTGATDWGKVTKLRIEAIRDDHG